MNGGAWTQVYNSTATSTTLNASDGAYTYRVQGCNTSGCGAFKTSSTLNVAIAPASITVPASVSTHSVPVSWSAVTNATSYVLQQSLNGGSWAQVYNGASTSATVTISVGGSYTYQVAACGTGGCSGYKVSSAVIAAPSVPPLTGPESSTTGSFKLSWSSETGSTTYKLNQKLNSGPWVTVLNSNVLSWNSNSLASGTYYYVVYACDGSVCSPASNQVTVIVSPIPIPPDWVTAPASVPLSVNFSVSWAPVSGATSYTVQQTGLDSGKVKTYTSSTTSVTAIIGVPGDYQFAVQACDSAGCSGWRNAPNITEAGSTTNAAPAGSSGSAPASGSSQ